MAEDDDWKDTNVGGIGTDEDKALRKMAAGHEPAWENAGTEAGLQVWRIEHFQVVPVDPDTYGKFHKGDSYIVLQTIKGDDDVFTRSIYFLLGSETSIDEQGTAAYKSVELDDWFDGEASQHRQVMGEESDEFKSLFDSYEYLEGGIDSGFKHVVPEGHDTRMWQVRRVKGKTTVVRVPTQKKKINQSDCFVLDAANAIYVLDGENASPFEKQAANQKAEEIESERAGAAQATHDIDDDFWACLEE